MVLLISSFIVIFYASILTILYTVFYSEELLSIKLLEPVPGSEGDIRRPTETSRLLLIATSILLLIIYIVLSIFVFFFPEIACNIAILVPFLGSFTCLVVMAILHLKIEKDKRDQLLPNLVVTGVVLLLLVTIFKQQYVMTVFLLPFLEKTGANSPRYVLPSYGVLIMLLNVIGLIFSKRGSWLRTIVLALSTLCAGYLIVEMIMQWPK